MSKESKEGWALVRDLPRIPRLLRVRFGARSPYFLPVGNTCESTSVSEALWTAAPVRRSWRQENLPEIVTS